MKKLFFFICILNVQKISAQQGIAKPFLFLYDNLSLQQNTDTITIQPLQMLALTNAKGIT